MSVLEIAEKFASREAKPKRSILFVWHVGEEKGLLGSAYFTDHPTVPRDSIVAQLNMDMVGRGDACGHDGHHQGRRARSTAARLLAAGWLAPSVHRARRPAREGEHAGKHGFPFDYAIDANGHPPNIYCRSDHYEYARYGIPIIFFTTGGHSDYHQVTDEPEYIDYDHMAKVDNFIGDLLVRVANLDHRVVVDHPKPNPMAACQQ